MFNQSGLSLDQAPPIQVVFHLFIVGSIFGILAGLSMIYWQDEILNPSTTGAIIFTHLLTLGVMLSFMFGALFQMLPVIAGVTINSPTVKGQLVTYALAIGIISLVFAFYTHLPWLFVIASILLGTTLIYLSSMMLSKLFRLPNHSASSRGMLVALLSLLLLTIFALYLTGALAGLFDGAYYTEIKKAHYSFGLLGWISILIISISFQTIEMFYVTPSYPRIISKFMPIFIVILIFLSMFFHFVDIIIFLALIYYALLTLLRLSQRKRPLTDATVWFWRMGMSSLTVSMALLIVHSLIGPSQLILQLSIILFISFVLSVLFSMFYKIVPFLTWFHLNSQGYFTAPMMHEVIHPKTAKKHLWIHLAVIISFLLSTILSFMIIISGLLMMLSFAWVGYQIIHALKLYKNTQDTGEKFDMGMMTGEAK